MWGQPRRGPWTSLLFAALLATSGQAGAADSKAFVEGECAQCHTLEKPAEFTVERMLNREAPDLYYAGNKFRREWLVEWLQEPERIRPAGTYFGQNVVMGDERDIVPEDKLEPHPAYSAEEAENAADYLMTLRPYDDLIAEANYQEKPVSGMMGKMNFGKFKGCDACHEPTPGTGGLSGPEVHTAFARATPEFLFSFIKNPQAWEPRTFMPNPGLNDGEVNKLVNYLRFLSEE
jgi:cytochrome c2